MGGPCSQTVLSDRGLAGALPSRSHSSLKKRGGCRSRFGSRLVDRSAPPFLGARTGFDRGTWSLPPPGVVAAEPESSLVPTAPACRNTPRLTRWPRGWFSSPWWRILSPRLQPRRWLMAQPKGYAAFILFPHLKMIPPTGIYPVLFMRSIPFDYTH